MRDRLHLAAFAALLAVLLPILAFAHPAAADTAPPTGGDMMSRFLVNAAFCENFSSGPYTGTAPDRGGALDPAKWSFARVTEGENAGQNALFAFHPADAMFCQTPLPGVLPDHDSFMCNGTNGVTTQDQGTEDMHWMTAANDGGDYLSIGPRALQPFDFAGRTGTVSFMVDAVTQGPHSTWPSLVLSDQPISMPHKQNPGVDSPPRNGLQIDWNAGCGTPAVVNAGGSAESDYPQTKVGMVSTFANYQESALSVPWQPDAVACVAAQADHPNLIQVQISQTSLDVWMADAISNMAPGAPMAPPTLKHVLHLDASNGYHLDMTRGYVSFEQAQYAACKFNASCQRTYHWHAIGFDGPALGPDAVAEVPDSLSAGPGGQVNVGYLIDGAHDFDVAGLPANGQPGYVTFDWREDGWTPPKFAVRVNGNPAIPVVTPPNQGYFGATNAYADVPAGELLAGGNTVELDTAAGLVVANLDLGEYGADAAPPAPSPTATATATSTPTATATATASPSATATPAPTATPTPAPSATATPLPASWRTTVALPSGHHAPVVCSWQGDDWTTLRCQAATS